MMINAATINASSPSSWVQRASLVALASALAVGCSPVRTAHGACQSTAVASARVELQRTTFAQSIGLCESSGDADAVQNFAGRSIASSSSFGVAAVRREVYGNAVGEAFSRGESIPGQAIGDSLANATSSATALAHIVHPAAAYAASSSISAASAVMTAWPRVLASAGVGGSWAEGSIKASGSSFFAHDGFCLTQASATGTIDAEKTVVMATIGCFESACSTSWCDGFIIFPGSARQIASATTLLADGNSVLCGEGMNHCIADGAAEAVRVAMATASETAGCSAIKAKAWGCFQGAGRGTAESAGIPAEAVREVFAEAHGVLASAIQATCEAGLIKLGRVQATLASALSGRAYGVCNSEISAPTARCLIVSLDDRSMIVAAENRRMVST